MEKTNVTIARNGDLVANMCLEVKLPQLFQTQGSGTYQSWTNGIGNALIKSVNVEIGGQEIDKHYGEWLDIWSELNLPQDKNNYNRMVGNNYPSDDYDPDLAKDSTNGSTSTLYIPLRFWFNRNPGLALPLIALQYHEVKINVEFEAQLFN